MRIAIGSLVLLLSFMGFSLNIKDRFKINSGFIPFILSSSYISSIYVFAKLSLMKEWIIIVNLIGIVLLFLFIKDKKDIKILFPEYWIFFIGIILIIFYLHNKEILIQDDLGHWGVVARHLISKNSLNTILDTKIDYKTYPQGAAYFIYGIVKFLGYSESNMLIANAIFILTTVFTLISLNKKDIVNYIFIIVVGVFACFYNIRFTSLRVDTTVATTAFAAFSYLYYKHRDKRSLYFTIPIFMTLTLLKTSALLFVAILLLFATIKYAKFNYKYILANIIAVIFTYLSWNNHTKSNFPNSTKHAISLSRYHDIYSKKTLDVIGEIKRSFFSKITHDYVFFILIIVLIIAYFITNRDRIIRNVLIASALLYLLYQGGNYFTYLYSMDVNEALRLESYDRYIRTMHIFLILVSGYVILSLPHNNYFLKAIYSVFLIVALIRTEEIDPVTERQLNVKHHFTELKDEMAIKPDSKILVIFNKQDSSRLFTRIAMFTFESADVKDTYPGDPKVYNEDDFDYVIREE